MNRRTFLKTIGLGSVGVLAAGTFGGRLAPLVAPVAAQANAIDDLALSLEFDPERIFRFVADEIRYEPYAGVLRGPEGTLLARAGNSADQSVLLAALLTAAGTQSRFVQGELAPSSVESILTAASRGAEAVLSESDTIIAAAAAELGTHELPEPDESGRQALARAAGLQADVEREVERRLGHEHSRMLGALAGAGVRLPAGVTAMPSEEQTRHVWVQSRSGPSWVDLDPVLPDAAPGALLTDVAAALLGPEELPRHIVTFRAVAETVSSGALRSDVILEHRVPAHELSGRKITFAMEKPEGLKALGAAVTGGLTGVVQYLPLLIVDQDLVLPTSSIRFGGGDDILGTALSDGPNEGQTTALWLEVTVQSPDVPSRTARRTIFDRVGESTRQDGAFDPARLEPVELVDIDGSGQQEYVPCRGVHLMSAAGTWSLPGELVGSTTEAPYGLDAFASFYHWMREGVGAAWAAPIGARPFCDGPNIAAVVLTPAMNGGELSVVIAVDLLARSLGTVGVEGVPVPDGTGILAGVASHLAERMLMGDTGVPLDGRLALPLSVGRIFEEAERQSIPLTVLHGPGSVPTLEYAGGGEARRLLSTALEDGYLVIAPERPVMLDGELRLGWWLVDPGRGTAWDQLDTGGGATLAEWAEEVWIAWRAAPLWQRLGICTLMAFNIALAMSIANDLARSSATRGLIAAGGNSLGIPLGAACGP